MPTSVGGSGPENHYLDFINDSYDMREQNSQVIGTSDYKPPVSRIALITGGSKGIGKAAAIALARSGVQVVVTYAADENAAKSVVAEIGSDKCLALKSDASDMEDIEELVELVVEKFGRIDVLIANAGVSISMV